MNSRSASESCTNSGSLVNCEGDPINCAMLRSVAKSNCHSVSTNDTKVNVDGGVLKSISDEFLTVPDSVVDEIDLSERLDFDGLGLDRSCPSPRSYSVMKTSITFNLQPFCGLADIISVLVLFTATVISLRILGS